MKVIQNFLDSLKMESTKIAEIKNTIPKYMSDMEWYQDSEQSIVTDGRYDLKRFSKHEADTVYHVINVIREKYHKELRSMGFANESYPIKYKPRYVLWEILVQLYENSSEPIDMFACALAYEAKGALFREKALQKFEKSINYITPEFMQQFISYMPLNVYIKFSRLYESNHEYEKAILYTELGHKYGDRDNPYFDNRIAELKDKIKRNPKKNESIILRKKHWSLKKMLLMRRNILSKKQS
ncbi:hypothetical protein [Sellimonas intestinalis]|uniref:hypothetical protein n=1 Tax=Sellimonas intestinalis TaxID=1653434 RepID=UPI003999B6BD